MAKGLLSFLLALTCSIHCCQVQASIPSKKIAEKCARPTISAVTINAGHEGDLVYHSFNFSNNVYQVDQVHPATIGTIDPAQQQGSICLLNFLYTYSLVGIATLQQLLAFHGFP